MPELPDVEMYLQYFEDHALGKEIVDVEVLSKKSLRHANEDELRDLLLHDSFKSAERYGKWLIIDTKKGKHLAMHFGMTGCLGFTEDDKMDDLTRVTFNFRGDKKLLFIDQRKFGGIEIIKDKKDLIKKHHLGTDALKADWKEFKKLLDKKRGAVKPVLMDQSQLSGIGNIYADEILFQADIHPKRKVPDISEKELKTLFNKIQHVLKLAIKHHADSKEFPTNFLTPHRKKGKEWKACRGPLKKVKVSGRATYFCPRVQKND